ncbi:MAG: hypothetical protein IJJ28_05720, partial [Lentisphaeria bacterium]|nr:hypothetical protein [Lentisphaeria bacterium]
MNTRDLLFTAALGAALTASADTSWLIRPYASASGRTQLFASRADKPRPLAVRAVLPPKGKGYKSLRFGDKSGFTYAGINEFGVAATFSGAGPTGDKPNAPKRGEHLYPGNAAVDLVLRSSKSAKQGVEALRKVARRGLIEHSMIILIADAKQAFVVEAAARHIAVYELSLAYTVHTHQWKLPGMEDASMRIPIGENTNAQREWVAATGLAKARKNDRKISVAEAIAVSRLNPADVKREGIRSAPSGDAALDACLFEIDPKYPGMLSCVYAAIGPQRHTVYLP